MNKLHGIVFAYESNAALRELTQHRTTSSLPFGGRFRLVDFMLSNLVNAGVSDVGLIVHSNYQSLLDHVGSGKSYDLSRKEGGLNILPPFSFANRPGAQVYLGHMDALSGVYSYLQNIRQEYVFLATSDFAANIPVSDMLEAHLKSGADITALCVTAPTNRVTDANYYTLGAGGLISDVAIAPKEASGCESMEAYILSKELLLSLVEHCSAHGINSFSKGVIRGMCTSLRISPYFFEGYAARIQSVQSYYARSMELLDAAVRRDLFNPKRPIRTKDHSVPAVYYAPSAQVSNSLIAYGSVIEGTVENSLIYREVKVEKGAVVKDCVLMPETVVGAGANISCIVTDKHVKIGAGRTLVGYENYPIAIAKYEVV